ncbi:MAG: hypothetical protein QM740_20760 [Acidovorax sp.]
MDLFYVELGRSGWCAMCREGWAGFHEFCMKASLMALLKGLTDRFPVAT